MAKVVLRARLAEDENLNGTSFEVAGCMDIAEMDFDVDVLRVAERAAGGLDTLVCDG